MPVALDEGLQRGGAVRPPHAAARDDHRSLGLGQERDIFASTAAGSPSVRGAASTAAAYVTASS